MVNLQLILCFINTNWYFWGNLTVFCLFHFNIISSFWKWQMDFLGAALGISTCITTLKTYIVFYLLKYTFANQFYISAGLLSIYQCPSNNTIGCLSKANWSILRVDSINNSANDFYYSWSNQSQQTVKVNMMTHL